jgi:hypothetical protein
MVRIDDAFSTTATTENVAMKAFSLPEYFTRLTGDYSSGPALVVGIYCITVSTENFSVSV